MGGSDDNGKFQHTAARRRLGIVLVFSVSRISFQHTAARRRLEYEGSIELKLIDVSTHSRPKAAGCS